VDLAELVARERARDTIASYTALADRGHFNDVARLFLPDGVLEVEGVGGGVARGRAEIVAFFRGVADAVRDIPVPGRMQHHVASVHLEVASPTEIRAGAYFTVMTGAGVDHWGRYRDVLAPSGDRWLFAHRLVRTDGMVAGGWADARRAGASPPAQA
jgi:hypothetical protein